MIPKNIVVPVDGSEFAERAMPVARVVASALGGDVKALTGRWVDRVAEAQQYMRDVAQRFAPIEIDFQADRNRLPAGPRRARGNPARDG
jgi:nucleotide-binding universal stress UspA family protein